MKAMVLDELNSKLVYRDYPDPTIDSPTDVIIRVKACGVCATDLKVISGHIDSEGLPRIVGHEPAGEVIAVGSAVRNVKIGDNVISATYQSCKQCEYCRSARDTLCGNVQGRLGITVDGGFAEQMKLQAACLVKIPDGVDVAKACVLPCGAGVSYHALVKRIQLSPADKVIVLGAGGLGIQAVQMATLCGAEAVAVDLDDEKLALAKKNGASYVVNTKAPDYMEQLQGIKDATVLFDSTAISKLVADCMSVLKKGARVVFAGYGPHKTLEIPFETIALNEFELYGSRGVGMKDVEDLIVLLKNGKINPAVTKYPLCELNDILEKMKNNTLVGRAVMIP